MRSAGWLSLFLALGFLVPSRADDRALARDMMSSAAFDALLFDRMTLLQTGFVRTGESSVPFGARLALTTGSAWGDGRPRLEFRRIEGATLVQRAVGDGTLLWHYNAVRDEYGSLSYGTSSLGGSPLRQLLVGLGRLTWGRSGILARLAMDLWRSPGSAPSAAWTPWLPVGELSVEGSTIVVRQGDDRVVYELDPPGTGGRPYYRLRSVRYEGWDRFGAFPRLTEWMVEVRLGWLPEDAEFRFAPPLSARLVALPGLER